MLQSFLQREGATLPAAELARFEQILDLPDPELFAYLTGRNVPRDPDIGRLVERITVKAMLRPEGLARLTAPEHRFCPTPACPVVYFGLEEIFDREEIVVLGTLDAEPARAQVQDLGKDLMNKASEQGGALGTAAQLGTTISDMQTHVNELQKNLETLNKIKAALGG